LSVYSTVFYAAELPSAGDSSVYVVPAGYVAVLRSVLLFNHSGAAAFAVVYEPGSFTVLVNDTVADETVLEWQGRVVFNAGEDLHVDVGTIPFSVRLSGYLLRA